MKTNTTNPVTEPATYQTASPDQSSKPTVVTSSGSSVISRVVTTKQQSKSITVRVTTRPFNLDESTT